MSSSIGENLRLTLFGQSHSPAVGMTIEGFPAGFLIDMERLHRFLRRRMPGQNEWSTPRKEPDVPEFLAGLEKAYGGKLPTEDEKEECMKGLSTLFGDGVPTFGDSGTALQLDSKKFFVGRIGDLSIEITYAAPQFVKKGDSFELARKGAVVANILQTPMLVETPKK